MMKEKNIALTGFMGAGKTSTARELSELLKRQLVSTDEEITRREGVSISDIFSKKGEPYFRAVEAEVVKSFSHEKNLVIDCGGGVVLNEENVKALKQDGLIIYLKTSPEQVYERVKNEIHRPLLMVDDPLSKIRELLMQRSPYYEQADYCVMTDGKTPEQVAGEIVEIFEKDTKTLRH